MRNASCVPFTAALLTTTILSAQVVASELKPTLDTVTVYATKSEKSTFDVPAMVSTVDADAPGNALANDTDGLLRMTPGVDVVNGPRRNGQTVTIRGFDAEAIITLMDGRRQNYESAHDGRFYFDPALMKRVEIVKGASSSIYGGGGVGGVVAFETKDASDLLRPGQNFGAMGSFGGRTGNSEVSSSASVYGRTENIDVLGSLALRSSGDIRDGDGGDLQTDDQVLSALLKLGYTFNDWHTFKLQYQGLNNDGQEPNNGAGAIGSSNPVVDKLVEDHQFSARYEFSNPDNDLLNLKIHAYYNDTKTEEEDISGANLGRIQVRDLNTTGLTIDNQSNFFISDNHNHTLSYGVEIYRNVQEGTSTATGDGTRPGVPDAEAINWGLYLQDEIEFDTAVGKFLIIPAARFDQFRSEDNSGNSQNESAVSPKIAVSYKPTDDVVFFGSLAQAFRAPNMTELYPSGQHFPGGGPIPDNNFVPNPDLSPETVTTLELGAGINFEGIATEDDALRIKGAWHYSRGKDFITQEVDVFGGTTENLNIDNAELWGVELESEYRISAFAAKAGLTYVEAKNDDTGEYLSNNVPLTLTTDFSYEFESISSTLGWRSRFATENDHVGSGEDTTAGYGVHDIYYRYAPSEGDFKHMTLDLGIENVFDKYYTKRFATLPEEGINFAARVTLKW